MAPKSLVKQISDVDIRLLRVFHAIVASGGLSAAELTLNIGRSTISRHLTDLEVRLGIKLCDRGPAGFSLTREGERVLEASTHLLAAIDTFRAEVNDVHDRLVGTLAIALFENTITNPKAQISTAFRSFDAVAPDVKLQVSVESINDIENGILNGRLALGIIPSHRKSASLDYDPLYDEQMFLYCGLGHTFFDASPKTIRTADVRAAKYAGLAYHSPNMMVSNQRRLRRHAEANDEEALAALILSGRYIGFLPDHFARVHITSGSMRTVRPDLYNYQSDFAAIVRKQPKPSRATETFLACLREAHQTDEDTSRR